MPGGGGTYVEESEAIVILVDLVGGYAPLYYRADEAEIGKVIEFFAKPSVAAIVMTAGSLAIGDTIKIKGATTDFEQKIESMEIDRKPVTTVSVGQSVGIKVKERVRLHDKVFKLQ